MGLTELLQESTAAATRLTAAQGKAERTRAAHQVADRERQTAQDEFDAAMSSLSEAMMAAAQPGGAKKN